MDCGQEGGGGRLKIRWTTFVNNPYLQLKFGLPLSDADLGREDVLLQNVVDGDVWWWMCCLGDPDEESPPPPPPSALLLSCLLQTGWWWREVVTVLVLLYATFCQYCTFPLLQYVVQQVSFYLRILSRNLASIENGLFAVENLKLM